MSCQIRTSLVPSNSEIQMRGGALAQFGLDDLKSLAFGLSAQPSLVKLLLLSVNCSSLTNVRPPRAKIKKKGVYRAIMNKALHRIIIKVPLKEHHGPKQSLPLATTIPSTPHTITTTSSKSLHQIPKYQIPNTRYSKPKASINLPWPSTHFVMGNT